MAKIHFALISIVCSLAPRREGGNRTCGSNRRNEEFLMTKRLAVLLAATAGLSLAQQTGITGRITDPSGATIVAAIVTATSDDGSKLETLTNAQGIYQFPALRAARYVLRVQTSGFAPAERTISVLVGQVASIDLMLQLATAST